MHLCAVAVLNVHSDAARTENIAVLKRDVLIFAARGLKADLERSSPVAPEYRVLDRYVLAVSLDIAVDALDRHRVVKRMNEGVYYPDVSAVHNVDPVRVIAPLAEYLDVIYRYALTAEKVHAPDGGIFHRDAFDP